MEFIDADGNIIIPKAVRPIIGIEETTLGSTKGAAKQYRYGRLHIRDYDSHYTVHVDKVDPRVDPVGHLLSDAPEYLAGAAAAVYVARKVGGAIYDKRRKEGKNANDAATDAVISGLIAGFSAGKIAFAATNAAKKVK